MALIRVNQLHQELFDLIDQKDIEMKKQIETSLMYTVGPTPPETPTIGYRWFDTTLSLMKVWNGEGDGADWEIVNANAIYLPGRNDLESLSNTMKELTTGNGFIDFGGRIECSKEVNKSMLANDGIPRIAGIVGDGDNAVKKFWFENFFLLNANGYSEETLPPSTGETTKLLVDGIPIFIQGTKPNSEVITNSDLMAINLPEAPNSPDELERDELVFIEIWKEDISEKGYVFPYGNVQFTGESADGIETVRFNGDVAYCESFPGDCDIEESIDESGNVVQTKVPKGRGWVWKNLKATFRNAIATNFKHNVFVDGDKLVQIRYRIRVVKFSKETPVPLTDTTYLGFTDNDANAVIKAQGKLQAPVDDVNYAILAPWNKDNPHAMNGAYSTTYNIDLSYDGYVYAVPVAIVSRRNKGVFDTTYNPNGSARFRDGLRLVADFDDSDEIVGFALMDEENATLASSTTGTTWDDKYKIMIKWLFDRETILESYDNAKGFVIGGDMNSGISGRYDGRYYDEINVRDIKDLRKDINKQLDLEFLNNYEFNKFIANEQRGWENEKHLYYWVGNIGYNAIAVAKDNNGNPILLKDENGNYIKGYGFVDVIPIYYKLADGTEIKGIETKFGEMVTDDLKTELFVRPGVEDGRDFYTNKFTRRVQVVIEPVLDEKGNVIYDENGKVVKQIRILDGKVYVDEKTEVIIVSPKGKSSRQVLQYADIIGDPKGNSYKFSTSMKVADLPDDIILENGNIVFTGQNYYVYRSNKIKTKSDLINENMDPNGYFKIDETDTNTWIDVTDLGGYSDGWKMYGNLGRAHLIDENGKSILPRDVVSGYVDENGNRVYVNTKFFKLSKPVKKINKVLVTVDRKAGKKAFLTQITSNIEENGEVKTILEQVNSTVGTFAFDNVDYLVKNNIIAINWESFTDDAIIEVYYEVDANPAELTHSTEVYNLGDVWVGNSQQHELGGVAISNLIDKVPVYVAPFGSKGSSKRMPLETYLISKGPEGKVLNSSWTILKHADVDLDGYGPAVKVLPYITVERNKMYLTLLYKELDPTLSPDGKAYVLDNGEFVVVDGEKLDNNGGLSKKPVKVGQRRIELPYYFFK